MRIIAIGLAALSVTGCTLTNAKDEPVVLTAANAKELIKAQMMKGCPTLIAAGDVVAAIAKAINAAVTIQGDINTANNMASIACSLLVPPPVVVEQPAATLPMLK